MVKVFCMYRLKDGVTREDYERWSREVDQQIIPRLDGCTRFETYAIDAADDSINEGNRQAAYDYIDDIEVESWEAWQASLTGPAGAEVVRQWLTYADLDSVTIVYGHRVVGGIEVLEGVSVA